VPHTNDQSWFMVPHTNNQSWFIVPHTNNQSWFIVLADEWRHRNPRLSDASMSLSVTKSRFQPPAAHSRKSSYSNPGDYRIENPPKPQTGMGPGFMETSALYRKMPTKSINNTSRGVVTALPQPESEDYDHDFGVNQSTDQVHQSSGWTNGDNMPGNGMEYQNHGNLGSGPSKAIHGANNTGREVFKPRKYGGGEMVDEAQSAVSRKLNQEPLSPRAAHVNDQTHPFDGEQTPPRASRHFAPTKSDKRTPGMREPSRNPNATFAQKNQTVQPRKTSSSISEANRNPHPPL
jgi:hypothetical protein